MSIRLIEALRRLAQAGHYTSPDRIIAARKAARPAPQPYWMRKHS